MSKPKIIFELPLGGYFSIPPLILDSLVGKSLRLCTVNQLWGRTPVPYMRTENQFQCSTSGAVSHQWHDMTMISWEIFGHNILFYEIVKPNWDYLNLLCLLSLTFKQVINRCLTKKLITQINYKTLKI